MNVGIFFKQADSFLLDAVSIAAGEPYGDAIQHGGHYEYHEACRPISPIERQFKAHDYDYYPRGRVVYFPNRNVFVLYTDSCLTPDDINRVISLFDLDGQTVEIAMDEHYKCAKCGSCYLEF